MRSLGFAPLTPNRSGIGKRVREARFERRSSLPASAACVVANGVRETLSALLGSPVTLRLFEPVIPDPPAWQAISRDATLYRVRGSVADAAIVLRADDAIALTSAVFGEPASPQRTLSPIECDVVERVVNAIAANLIAVCGARDAHCIERVAAVGGFVTFFEMAMEKPVEARIGVALSRDPAPEPRGRLELVHLGDVRVSAVAALDLGSTQAAAVARLAVGALIPIRSDDLRRCTLAAAGRRLAHGACGIRNGRYAIVAKATRASA